MYEFVQGFCNGGREVVECLKLATGFSVQRFKVSGFKILGFRGSGFRAFGFKGLGFSGLAYSVFSLLRVLPNFRI